MMVSVVFPVNDPILETIPKHQGKLAYGHQLLYGALETLAGS